jgi:O-succinylbenzoate synthase
MVIERAEAFRYRLRLTERVVMAGIEHTHRTGYLLQLTSEDGLEAWGDAAPLPGFSHETVEETEASLHQCAKRLSGYRLPRSYNDLEGSGLLHLPDTPSVSFALETAYYGLLAQTMGVGMARIINPSAPTQIRLNGLLMGTPQKILADAARCAEAGYSAVKMKAGRGPIEADAELVHAVRDVIGDRMALRLDANRAWPLDDAVQFGRRVSHLGIEYIEEPLRDPHALPDFHRRTGVPYALDETLQAWRAPAPAKRGGLPRAWSLEEHTRSLVPVFREAAACIWKPTLMHVPNLRAAIAWGMFFPMNTIVISAAFESGVGILALGHYAAAFSGNRVPVGLDTYRWLAEDVTTERLPLAGPSLDLESPAMAPGMLDLSKLEPLTRA